MSRINWTYLIGSSNDASESGLLGFLRDVEVFFVKLIKGIWYFFAEQAPELFRAMLDRLRIAVTYSIRIAVRLVRVGAVVTSWVFIVFGPLWLYPGVITVLMTLFALAGSVYGLYRRDRKKRAAVAVIAPADRLAFIANASVEGR